MSHDSRLKGITISKKTSGKGVTGIIIKGTPEISCDAKVTITLKNTRASIENSFNAHIKSIAIKDKKISNAKPELTTTSIPSSATVGKEYSANISATHNPTSWILLGTLPDGLNFNTSTGAL